MAIKLQGDRKGWVLASQPVVGKLSPTVRESLFLPFVVKRSPDTHVFSDMNCSGEEMERDIRPALVGRTGHSIEKEAPTREPGGLSVIPSITFQPDDFTCLGLGVPLEKTELISTL